MLFTGRRESRLSPPKKSELKALAAEEANRQVTKTERKLLPGRLDGLFVGKLKETDPSRIRAEASAATSTTGVTSDSTLSASITTTSTRPDGTTHTITRGFEVKQPTPPYHRAQPPGSAKAQPASPKTTAVSPAHVMSPKAAATLPPRISSPTAVPRTRRQSTIAKEEAAQPFILKPPTSPPPWQIILNPSNPKTTITQDSSQYRRWQHVTPRPTSVSHMKWKSMRTPAALPLQSAYFPKEEELRDEYEHTLSQSIPRR